MDGGTYVISAMSQGVRCTEQAVMALFRTLKQLFSNHAPAFSVA
jgi:hypothetical protein